MEISKQKVKLLCRGANSQVYLYGEDDAAAVLKMVSSSSKEAKHLANQYAFLKMLNHENIIQPFKYSEKIQVLNSVGEQTVRNILVLEYASHGSLLTVIKNQDLAVSENRYLFVQLCEAVEFLHCNYIVHRDLKLQNVLVCSEKGRKVVKLADFGFADYFMKDQHIIHFKNYKGTKKAYMAPQIHQTLKKSTKTYDARKCDVFALGVILFTLLCKRYPFEYATAQDTNYKLIIEGKEEEFWNQHSKTMAELQQRILKSYLCGWQVMNRSGDRAQKECWRASGCSERQINQQNYEEKS